VKISVGFLVVGVLLAGLDRFLDKGKLEKLVQRWDYFLHHYEPFWGRRHFVGLMVGMCTAALAGDYLLSGPRDMRLYMTILAGFLVGPPVLLGLLACGQYLLEGKGSFRINYLNLEHGFIQQFSLALCHPLFGLAYVGKNFLILFRYPLKRISYFQSLAGLAGLILTGLGIMLELYNFLR